MEITRRSTIYYLSRIIVKARDYSIDWSYSKGDIEGDKREGPRPGGRERGPERGTRVAGRGLYTHLRRVQLPSAPAPFYSTGKGRAMNRLSIEKQSQALTALLEGSSVRSTERMTGVHRDTIIRLMIRVVAACDQLMDEKFRNLSCRHLQLDELWCFVGKKQRHVRPEDDSSKVGDFWTFTAVDTETKLVPSFLVGKRTSENTRTFVADLASRMEGRVQLSSDMMDAYVDAIELAFGCDVDYGRIVKQYEAEQIGPGRYSPPKVVRVARNVVSGRPIGTCTSHVERLNLSTRMHLRRFTRLTNGFSKRPENLRAAVSLWFGFYNFARIHRTLRVTPAMEAGVVSRVWTVEDLARLAA